MKKVTRSLIPSLLLILVFSFCAYALGDPYEAHSQYLPEETPAAKRHFRAAWIATVSNLDWPSPETAALTDDAERVSKSKEEMIFLLDQAVSMKLNAVFFQVSPAADALYASDMMPWSSCLTGTLGKDPGFDPLAFVIEEAHRRNLEVHAWFNPYRVSTSASSAAVVSLNVEKSVYMDHPDWIRTSDGKTVLDPGLPEVREWVVDRVLEVVRGYDIDGVHFDDYFYTERVPGELNDNDTYLKYNGGQFANIGDWRRNNTYLLIKEVHEAVNREKRWVKFGVSPVAIWENRSELFPEGSNTTTEYTSYSRMFADTKKWVEDEIVDYIAPQIYFSFANTRAPYGELADWWSKACSGRKVHLYIGQALYKVNADPDAFFCGDMAAAEMSNHLKYDIARREISGDILFRISCFGDEKAAIVADMIRNDLWKTYALVPVMGWKGGAAPQKPSNGLIDKTSRGIKITWSATDQNTAYYAVYRYEKYEPVNLFSDECAKKLIGTVRKTSGERQEFFDRGTTDTGEFTYVVTALDRLHNESQGLEISTDQSKYFYDVGKSHAWAVYSIDYLCKKGIVIGDGKGYYYPSHNTRRADFVIMLVRAFGLDADVTSNYADVPGSAYFYEAVGIAKALGVAPDEENFRPLDNITREDMFVMMLKVLETKGIILPDAGQEYITCYSDHSMISGYAKEAVAKLTKAGLMAGSGGKADPKAYSTRAEIAAVLFRMIAAMGSGSYK